MYVCPYLDDSIKSWDCVDLSSLRDQLALNFIPHCLDSMGVWANECHALCRLATKQYREIYLMIYLMNTYNNTIESEELKFHPTAGLATLTSTHSVFACSISVINLTKKIKHNTGVCCPRLNNYYCNYQ